MARKVLLISVLVLLLAGQALAQIPSRFDRGRTGRWDIALQTRYTTSRSFDMEGGSSISFKDDLGWGFGIGYNFNEAFNLGFKVSWKGLNYDATVVSADDPPAESANVSGQMDSSTLALTGMWTPLKGRFSPYVNGSLGWVNLDTNVISGISSGCWYYPYWGYVCGNYTNTYGVSSGTYDLGLGLRIGVSEDLFFRVGYEHAWVDDSTYDGSDVFRVDFGGLF